LWHLAGAKIRLLKINPKGTPSYAFGNVFSSTQENKRNASSTFTVDALGKSLPLGHLSSAHTYPTRSTRHGTSFQGGTGGVHGCPVERCFSGELVHARSNHGAMVGECLSVFSDMGEHHPSCAWNTLGFKLVLNSFGGE
jgi:hypothetical protein